ncbi:MAG: NAD(P)/FAD-dependent oxidoreductase [bacterium]|nr:NAD(P)/FAD-dependent oxidoreductase [bacterium]
MTNSIFDVIILGGGPAGYTAAERLSAAGRRVLLIERAHLGGTCLNHGCIPSKALLASAKLFAQVQMAERFGVQVGAPSFLLSGAVARKRGIVSMLRDGIGYQMSKHNVTVINGAAHITDPQTVTVDGTPFTGRTLILAAGAAPRTIDLPGAEQPHVIGVNRIMDRETLPKNLVILGGDAIAFVIASIFALVGVRVTLVTETDTLLPDFDPDVMTVIRNELKQVTIHTVSRPLRIERDQVVCAEPKGEFAIPADTVVVSHGRVPHVSGYGLEQLDLDVDAHGVRTDDHMRTNLPHVYAAGDVTGRSLWAHSAIRMGEVAANTILGIPDRYREDLVPKVLYTYPEAAAIGLNETEAKRRGLHVKTARLPMNANGRFLTETEGKRGLCKLIADADTGRLLGVQWVSVNASDLIASAAAMISDEFRVRDLTQMTFPHPTMSEILKDAALLL